MCVCAEGGGGEVVCVGGGGGLARPYIFVKLISKKLIKSCKCN